MNSVGNAQITMSPEAIDRLMVDHFLDAHERAPEQIILDLHATTIPFTDTKKEDSSTDITTAYC